MATALLLGCLASLVLAADPPPTEGRQSVSYSSSGSNTDTHRFRFGTGQAADSWIIVRPGDHYGVERGYGFDLDSEVEEGSGGVGVASVSRFFFSVALPEGTYNVAVEFVGGESGSTNTVKAESRRLMIEREVVAAGASSKRTFTVNIRTPSIQGGGAVRLKDREKGVLHWDDKLTLEFNGSHPTVARVEVAPAPDAITVFLLGDSTVTDQPKEPWNSWGQMLTRFFKPGVAVANHAESGESLKSSLGARRVAKVFSQIRPGDYVFVQFGHNDMKDRAPDALETYRRNLTQLVADIREHGATPVLITSMERMAGVKKDTLAGYPDTVREVARAEGVTLIDLHKMSRTLYQALGPNLKLAFQDGTHHNGYGSYLLAKCVVEGIRTSDLPLARHLARDVVPFDPAHPDALASFDVPASPSLSEQKPDGD